MASAPQRYLRAMAAALLGAGWYMTLFAVAVAFCAVVVQQAALWFETGSLDLATPPAQAGHRNTVTVAGATPSEARAVNAALATLRYRPPSGSVTYGVTNDLGPQSSGDFASGINLIQVRRDVVRRGGAVLRQTLAHEIGHYVDFNLLTDRERARFYQLRKIPMKYLWIDTNQPWEQTPSEDFAEVFASLAVPSGQGRPSTAYGPVTDPAEVERLLRDAGVRFGRRQPAPTAGSIVRRQIGLVTRALANRRSRLVLVAGVLISGAFGAASAWHKAWMSSPALHRDI